MGKTMTDRAGQRRPARRCDRDRCDADRFGQCPRFCPPRGRRDLDHAAEQPLFRPAAQQHGAIGPRNPKRDAIAHRPFRFFGACRQILGEPLAQRRRRRCATGTARSAAGVACRSWRRDPSSLARNPRRGVRAPALPRAPAAALSPPASAHRQHKAGRRPARHCHQPQPPDDRTQSPQLPRRCSRQCPAMRASPTVRPERPRHGARQRRARKRADCGRGRNSRAPAIHAALRRVPPRRAPSHPASASQIGRSRVLRSPPSSVAA